jgi:hypothetical protein
MPTEKTYDRILVYLKGLLSDRQRHDLEKEMMHDVFDEEAFEGLSQLSAVELQADMEKLENSLQNRITLHKKRNLKIYFRLAAGILLLAGLTGLLYLVLRTPSANLISNENVKKKEAPKSATPSAPLMEIQSVPVESIQKGMPVELKSKKQEAEPIAVPEKEKEFADFKMDTIAVNDNLLAQEEVVVVSYAEKKAKSIDRPLTNEPAPDASVRVEQALQGKAAGVQVTSRSENESADLSRQSTFPELSKPIPPGGSLKTFKRWVYDRLDYPAYKDYPGKHRITVVLTVRANGTISDIRIKEGPPEIIASDLKKIISQSSLWTAALKDDNPVNADIEIHFVITVE